MPVIKRQKSLAYPGTGFSAVNEVNFSTHTNIAFISFGKHVALQRN